MIRIGIAGALGRMGQTILRLACASRKYSVRFAWDQERFVGTASQNAEAVSRAGLAAHIALSTANTEDLLTAQVLIDFTSPEATLRHLALCLKKRRAMVIGTTGFNPAALNQIRKASKTIPIVLAPNMSVGANLLFELAETAAGKLSEDYDIEVVEAHHRQKADAPSGTAKRLAEGLARARGWNLQQTAVYGRRGIAGPRPRKQIGIHALRAGEIVGVHTAVFSGPGETIEITHRAQSRESFAQGALLAAAFAARKKKGLFDMREVIAR